MNGRQNRPTPGRAGLQPIHRAPQAGPPPTSGFHHAPNAALLIDFDNVTMGIRSDLQTELRNLLASDIIKGKVAVQRAYADWRRYPQYIVPLAESSIDMIMAPAYGSSKKNATDIRLAIDALELVFTRPEIGTFILLSGDSDFSSLVIKLKEYGKYVIGVGIKESSSDLLVMNCDEYYSYNSLAGLVRNSDEEQEKWDPWKLVSEAIQRMKRNGDVMRSDRLKQVMQDIDPAFDEKNLGMSKFSRFTAEAAGRGLLSAARLENGQYEVGLPGELAAAPAATSASSTPAAAVPVIAAGEGNEERVRRGRRGRGRGRGREREPREGVAVATPASVAVIATSETPHQPPRAAVPAKEEDSFGRSGERLTRDEAFALLRNAVEALAGGNGAARASAVRRKAFDLLGRDSESLERRMFDRILRDAHDSSLVDLRKRGDDFEVALAAPAESVADQLTRAAAAHAPTPAPASAAVPRGMGPRGSVGGRGRAGAGRMAELPPELLNVGIVDIPSVTRPVVEASAPSAPEPESKPVRGQRGRGTPAKAGKKPAPEKPIAAATPEKPAGRTARPRQPGREATSEPPAPKTKRARAKRATVDA